MCIDHVFFLISGSSTPIRHISLRSLIPNTDAYMTYEGSTTHPGCWESTVWIILNKPIYITKQEVLSFVRMFFYRSISISMSVELRWFSLLHLCVVFVVVFFEYKSCMRYEGWCKDQKNHQKRHWEIMHGQSRIYTIVLFERISISNNQRKRYIVEKTKKIKFQFMCSILPNTMQYFANR